MSQRYRQAFGERYSALAAGSARLERLFQELIDRHGLQRRVAPFEPVQAKQMVLF